MAGYVELHVIFNGRETDRAYLITNPETDTEHWVPFSQTKERHGKLQGGEGRILVSEWLARKIQEGE